MNHYLIEKLLQEQRRETEQDARRLRLIRQWERRNVKVRKPLIIVFADALIRAGERLKKQYSHHIECRQT